MDIYGINTPDGTRDWLYGETRRRRAVEDAVVGVFGSAGYSEIITPEVEFYDMFASSGSPIPQESMMKIVDKSGRILVMRPDNTMPIARVVASRLRGSGRTQRLWYNQTVFRSESALDGGESEIPQCGVELIGEGGIEADIEVISLAVKALEATGAGDFHIELGHAGFFRALTAELGASGAAAETIRTYVERKNYAALKDYLTPYASQPAAKALGRLSYLFGGVEVLDEAEALFTGGDALAATSYLRTLYGGLKAKGYEKYVRFDLGLVNQIDYYTGVVFRGYVYGAAASVLSGGRYDRLLSSFGVDAPATGFAIDTAALQRSLTTKGAPNGGRLRIAITKGRLLEKSIEMFEKMGLDCSVVKNPGRKLVAEVGNFPLDVVMSKAQDVITYVEHGVCDLGIVGKDTILESGSSFFEVLDLGFGKCRFALAVKEGEDFYGTYKARKIASKYPNVAKNYFTGRGMDVSVIKIDGSVELAPILGLADGIVDIVETGSTLKANGLVPIETIHDLSARLIVNTASMKLHKELMLEFIRKCEGSINA